MTIAVALDYRPALLSPSGIGRAARELARALAALGEVEVHLFGHSLARARLPVTVPAGARLHRAPLPGRGLPWLHRCGIGADDLAGRPQVFHWTDYVHPPVRSARVVLTIHDLAFARDPVFHGQAEAERLLARTRTAAAQASALAVPSRATADDVARVLPEGRRTRVIPFGADHIADLLAALPRPAAAASPYVLALGTIEPRKNHRALLAAFRRLPAQRPRLVVVGGRGWRCDDIVADLQQAHREGWCQWLHDADDRTTFALLRDATALVYPSAWEGFGFPVLEAMAMGVPVLAGDCAALRELADDAALFAPGAEPDALVQALDRLLGDADLRARLRQQGPRRAAAFRWETCARAHAALYREVAA